MGIGIGNNSTLDTFYMATLSHWQHSQGGENDRVPLLHRRCKNVEVADEGEAGRDVVGTVGYTDRGRKFVCGAMGSSRPTVNRLPW